MPRDFVTIAEAERLVMHPTYELARVQFMGWTFGKPAITQDDHDPRFPRFSLRVAFTCVCGRKEMFVYTAMHLDAFRQVNVAGYLTRNGSFSREHLLSDGYTEEQVSEIERKGEEFDRITREHWELEMLKAGGYDEFRRHQHMLAAHAR